jgi:hypothetical protein
MAELRNFIPDSTSTKTPQEVMKELKSFKVLSTSSTPSKTSAEVMQELQSFKVPSSTSTSTSSNNANP